MLLVDAPHREKYMNVVRVLVYCISVVLCMVSAAVGVSSLLKYTNDKRSRDTVLEYSKPANCTIVSVRSISAEKSCTIYRYELNLSHSVAEPAASGYVGFSGFFPDKCGGLLINETGATVRCFFKVLDDPVVRLIDADSFEIDSLFLYVGYATLLIGVVPLAGLCVYCVSSGLGSLLAWCCGRNSITTSGGVVVVPTAGSHEPAGSVELSVLSPKADADWRGRLITKTDFAVAAVEKLVHAAVRKDDCPLCFRKFGDVVVWWTCGHFLCAECTPRVLALEDGLGRPRMPRCALCRERSDVSDIVTVKLLHLLQGCSTANECTSPSPHDDCELVSPFATDRQRVDSETEVERPSVGVLGSALDPNVA